MKRPLCIAALSVFAVQIFLLFLPQQAFVPIAAVFVCIFALLTATLKKHKLYSITLIAAACVIAIFWRYGYEKFTVKPAIELSGKTDTITARIIKSTVYEGGMMGAQIKVIKAEKLDNVGMNIYINTMPHAHDGETVSFEISYKKLKPSQSSYYFGQGVYIAGDYEGGFKTLENKSVYYFFDEIKQQLVRGFKILVDENIGIVGSAMAFGDKSGLSYEIKESFKATGLSHMLVVSGMHIAAASGIVFSLSGLLFKRRRLRALLSIIFVILFILLTGITPSAIRAGTMLCIVYLGMCFWRQADTITSLCTALLLLILQNPFMVFDMGFLLSFSATAGIVICNKFNVKLSTLPKFRKHKFLSQVIKLISVPLFASLATAPVLIVFNAGISVIGILFNIVAVPLLPFIVASCFSASVLSFIPVISIAAKLFAIFSAMLIKIILTIAKIAEALPFSLIYINGISFTLILLTLYLLIYLAVKYHIKAACVFISAFLVLSMSAVIFIENGVIEITALSNSQNAPIAVYKGGKCILIFREDEKNNYNVEKFIKQNNIKDIDCAVLLFEKQDANITSFIDAKQTIMAEDIFNSYAISVFDDIMITLKKQKNACAAAIDINGFKAVINTGSFDYKQSGKINVLLAGRSKAENFTASHILANNSVPKWLQNQKQDVNVSASSRISVRGEKSFKIYEDYYGNY